MSLFDAFSYKGKRVFVVGGATGMGAAAAEVARDAGAEVIVADRADIALDGVKSMRLDLSDKASIESAAEPASRSQCISLQRALRSPSIRSLPGPPTMVSLP